MPHYRLHTPDQTIDLGEHETARKLLTDAVRERAAGLLESYPGAAELLTKVASEDEAVWILDAL